MHNRKKAFTLVELLVVISIIALLLGILMPALNKVRQLGKRTVCKSNLHSVAQAFRMYLDDNRLVMPPAAAIPWNPVDPELPLPDHDIVKPALVKFLGPYLSVPSSDLGKKKTYAKVLCCPGDIKNGEAKHYFKIQESSYEYAERRGGRSMNKASFTKNAPERDVEILWDFEAFHGSPGKIGAKNYLFSDCHVGNVNGD